MNRSSLYLNSEEKEEEFKADHYNGQVQSCPQLVMDVCVVTFDSTEWGAASPSLLPHLFKSISELDVRYFLSILELQETITTVT